jgi:hypothetical protein
MIEEVNPAGTLPDELQSEIPRRGKWTPEEEKYTEKIICKCIWISSPYVAAILVI